MPRRRKYSVAEKQRIVRRKLPAGLFGGPSGTGARNQRESGFHSAAFVPTQRLGGNVLPAATAELVSVTISDSPAAPVPAPSPSSMPAGTIQLQLPRGRLRIEGAVDPDSLRVVLECLLA